MIIDMCWSYLLMSDLSLILYSTHNKLRVWFWFCMDIFLCVYSLPNSLQTTSFQELGGLDIRLHNHQRLFCIEYHPVWSKLGITFFRRFSAKCPPAYKQERVAGRLKQTLFLWPRLRLSFGEWPLQTNVAVIAPKAARGTKTMAGSSFRRSRSWCSCMRCDVLVESCLAMRDHVIDKTYTNIAQCLVYLSLYEVWDSEIWWLVWALWF